MAEITGKIKIIGDIQTFDSGFSKRQIVITTDEQYSSDIPMDFLKDKAELLNNYKVGEDVKVSVNIKGSEYNGKYYVGLNAWKIERLGAGTSNSNRPDSAVDQYNQRQAEANAQTFAPATNVNEDEPDDLPF